MISPVKSELFRESRIMSNEIERVGVVGLGVMGFDIAFLYAMKGFHTAVFDASPATMDSLEERR